MRDNFSNTEVLTFKHGVEGMPLSGTAEELKKLLDGYPWEVVHAVYWPEARARTPIWAALKGYYAERALRELEGR